MTFSEEDGKNVVKVHQIQSDGTFKDSEGTFTIDEKNKVLNLDIDIWLQLTIVVSCQ